MVFSSPIFLFWFLPMVLFFYYLVKKEFRNGVLLFFSLLFYGWGEPEMLAVMLVSTLINYLFGLWIEKTNISYQKKWLLFFGVISNVLLLFYYKYANFFADNYNHAASILGLRPVFLDKVVLPLGISFYTFHGMSYMIDVYRQQAKSQKNPLKLALYISFFPQLIAGPIVRYKDIEKQIDDRDFNLKRFSSGVKRFIVGLSKKVLVANVVGRVPEMVFHLEYSELNAYWSWLTIVAATVQVYLDFSGYSDMAIGLARMFGFEFKENFIYPFISKSMKEFWTRWHISLSSWFKDYVYIPLGGNQAGKFRTYINLWVVFLLTGFWHGASWSFIMFGAFHGLLIVSEKLGLEKILNVFPSILRNVYVFLVVAIGIVFFSLDNVSHIAAFYKSLFRFNTPDSLSRINLYLTPEWYWMLGIGLFISVPGVELVLNYIKSEKTKHWIEVSGLILLFLLCISDLASSTYNPFIYFRF